MKTFTPILEDKPLSYAEQHSEFRNTAREAKWGTPVYFVPSTWIFDQVGCGGPYYSYGYNANAKKGAYGNCTWWTIGRHQQNSGEILKCAVGDAINAFDKYEGRKDGTLDKRIYIGDTIQKGDCLIFADNLDKSGYGHINYVEDVIGNNIYITESAYSTKSIYKDKACIAYTLDKTKFFTTDKITLRPSLPYSEYVYGVIHTGDIYDKEPVDPSIDYKEKYEGILKDMQAIKEIACEY